MSPSSLSFDRRPPVLLVGFARDVARTLEFRLKEDVTLLWAQDETVGRRLLDEHEPSIVVLGAPVAGDRARRFVAEALFRSPAPTFLVLSGGADLLRFQELIDKDALFYLARESVPEDELDALVRAALSQRRSKSGGAQEDGAAGCPDLARLGGVIAIAGKVANQRELGEAGELVTEELCDLMNADRAYYLLYDPVEETLQAGTGERFESAAVGLMSYVVRTGRPVELENIGEDPRYERGADDPGGAGDERFLAAPLRDAYGQVIGALAAVRKATRPPFSEVDLLTLRSLADWVGAPLARLRLQERLELESSRHGGAVRRSALFRSEALESYTGGLRDSGAPLRLSPAWVARAYRLTLLAILAAAAFLVLSSVPVEGRGPAWIRVPGHREVPAAGGGMVVAVEADAGDRVEEGQILVRLRGLGDREGEVDVRAPVDGLVETVWVRPGLEVAPGQTVLALAPVDARLFVTAVLPGRYLGRIEPGMPLLLRLPGRPEPAGDLTISWVSDRALAPDEAYRMVGRPPGDALDLPSPGVVVEARADSLFLDGGGRRLGVHHGMRSIAEVPLGAELVLWKLFPRLRGWLETAGV